MPTQSYAVSSFSEKVYPIFVVDDGLDVDLSVIYGTNSSATSGWDVKDVRVAYNYDTAQLHFGINCAGVCGDADGDGDPGHTSSALLLAQGQDKPSFAQEESCALAVDIGIPFAQFDAQVPDGTFDFVIGYPARSEFAWDYPCTAHMSRPALDVLCFGVYLLPPRATASALSTSFSWNNMSAEVFWNVVATDHTTDNGKTGTSMDRPDLEWSLQNFSAAREQFGIPKLSKKFFWEIRLAAFCGSFADGPIGSDIVPNDGSSISVRLECAERNECNRCDNDADAYACLDCRGVAHGTARYDQCGVCNGNNSTCSDCAGILFGTSSFDNCGVCGGDGTSCLDCKSNAFLLARCLFPLLFTERGERTMVFKEMGPRKSCKHC